MVHRHPLFALGFAVLLSLSACGENPPVAPLAPSPEAASAVTRAAEAVWKAIDDYDAKSFAALSIDPKDKTRVLGAKDLDPLVMDLHQKYGARARRIVAGDPPTSVSETAIVYVVIGDREDAVSLTFARVEGAWKLSMISDADPLSIEPDPK